MANSVVYSLGAAVVTAINNLNLTDPSTGAELTATQLIAPRRVETLDPQSPARILVTIPDAPDKIEYFAFGKRAYYYTIIITVISNNNQDLTNPLNGYTQMRETIRNYFATFSSQPVLGVAGVRDMRVELLTVFHRGMLAQNLNYLQIGLQFKEIKAA